MQRVIPGFVAGVTVLYLMFNALSIESDAAHAATNNSTSLDAVDGVLQGVGQASAAGIPLGMLVAGVALVLGIALLAGAN